MRTQFAACMFAAAVFTSSCFGMSFNYAVTTPWKPAVCNPVSMPGVTTTFAPDDAQAVAYFGVSGAAVGDVAKVEYFAPGGDLIKTSNFSPLATAGNYCFNSILSIAGNPQTSATGMYTVKGSWNDNPLFALEFWILGPGLTSDQKLLDFQMLASLYAKRYAPADWKKTAFGYDVLNLQPWLDDVSAGKDDSDYLDTLVRYVAALNDTHSSYRTASDWVADLGLRVDGYYDDSGQNYSILIESINRSQLPSATFPFQTGDELVSMDGVKVSDLVDRSRKYVSAASADSALHFASSYLTLRYQNALPKAHLIGPSTEVEVRRQGSGAIEKYTLPWVTSGTSLTRIGSVAMPKAATSHGIEIAEDEPPYMRTIERFRNEKVEGAPETQGFGSLAPLWTRPDGFQQRLGRIYSDSFYSGVVAARGFNIGYLRIPTFAPASSTAALNQLDSEIAYLQDNTDGLVLDVMHNPGGDPCYGEEVLRRVMPNPWKAMARVVRPVWEDIADFQYDLALASYLNAPKESKDLLQSWTGSLLQTYQDGGLLSSPLSLCSTSGLDRTPASAVYRKPILLLVDELSTSAADAFSAQFQDNARGRLFGWRTNGAGGTVIDQTVGFYSEGGTARVVRAMQYRPNPVSTPEYPSSNYVENVGVRPDVTSRYNTIGNYSQGGKPFVDAFLDAIAADIQQQRSK